MYQLLTNFSTDIVYLNENELNNTIYRLV